MKRIVVIGAGLGGLTTAALLAKAGHHVNVLEQHVYPGGCAATFTHQGYRFDAGATLAGGFNAGGVMTELAHALDMPRWRARAAEPAMIVHMPDGRPIARWGNERRWGERQAAFAPDDIAFWRWQENTADSMWSLAQKNPPWPPSSMAALGDLGRVLTKWLSQEPWTRAWPGMALDALFPVARRLQKASGTLRTFVDGQLLISAQATSQSANALYAAAALDLPRRGVVQLEGGMGAIADGLVDRLQAFGGSIHHKQRAMRVRQQGRAVVAVETEQGDSFPADLVVGNLPPWNFARLFDGAPPRWLRIAAERPVSGWGAFVLYLGVPADVVSIQEGTHHQIILREPMGEGNTAFLSLSPEWDPSRAPVGRRAITMSTHTRLGPWWDLVENDYEGYEVRKSIYAERLLSAAAQIFPDLRDAVELMLPGTPISFQRYTGREMGWVGGFPQTSLFRSLPARLQQDVWLVGDSIFPGQSAAAVALGGVRVAQQIEMANEKAQSRRHHPAINGTMLSREIEERRLPTFGDGVEN